MKKYFLIFSLFIIAFLGIILTKFPDNNLHIIACNVGQGDAILISHQKSQILIDGGPDSRVLDCLADYLPFWDREIEVVIITHPQKDHYLGLIEVLRRYKVKTIVIGELESSSEEYQVLKREVGGQGVKVVRPGVGRTIRLGLIYLDIFSGEEMVLSSDPNDSSIVSLVRFGNFDALMTGDIGPEIINQILASGRVGDIEYLKVPHHGSKNGLVRELLQVSQPEAAVISVGKNQWGHPHQEVLGLLDDFNVKVYRTDESGSVEIITDGKSWWTSGEF